MPLPVPGQALPTLAVVRQAVVLFVAVLLAGCDLGPGEPPALYAAVSQDGADRVKRLLDEGSDPNQVYEGTRIIEEAAVVGSAETVQVLLAAGADPCQKDPRPSALADNARPQDAERRVVAALLVDAERRC